MLGDTPPVSCAKCGARLFLPEASEYCDAQNLRHHWNCETCNYSFETTVRLRPDAGGVGPTSNDL